MLIESMDIQGLAIASGWSQSDLGARVALPAAPKGVAIADGLSLIEAVLCPERFGAIAGRLGLLSPEQEVFLDDAGFVEQAVGLHADGVDALLAELGNRRVTVAVTVVLDPPLFGRLREEAMRDPRVTTALGQTPTLRLKVGWLFSMSREAVSVGVLDVRVGDTSFALNKSDRPSWMNGMLRAIGGRLGRVDWTEDLSGVTRRLQDASVSASPEKRRAFERISAAMAAPPFEYGALGLIGMGEAVLPAFGPELVRARLFGPGACRALRLAEAALLRAPDVLIVEEATAAEAEWLVTCIEGEDATLEQVWILGDA